MKGLKETVRNPSARVDCACSSATTCAKKEVELERLRMAIRDNVVTPEVRANGFGAIDPARLEESDQPDRADLYVQGQAQGGKRFRPSFLPPIADRRVN